MTLHTTPRAAGLAAFFEHRGSALEAATAAFDAYEAFMAGRENTPVPLIFESSKIFARGDVLFTVLIQYGDNDGAYYVVDKHKLAALKRGVSPEELELSPIEDEEA